MIQVFDFAQELGQVSLGQGRTVRYFIREFSKLEVGKIYALDRINSKVKNELH